MKKFLAIVVAGVVLLLPMAPMAHAAEVFGVCSQPEAAGAAVCTEKDSPRDIQSLLTVAMNVLSIVAGFAGVLMLIWGGMKYIVANGDGQNTARAKDTILFAVIGLAIAIVAQAVSFFIINRLMG